MVTIIPLLAAEILERDLLKLESEIKLFQDETNLWRIVGDIKNPAGNLVLHICGNLQHFIGAVLGGSGYIRNRDAEFADKNISQEKLQKEIHQTIEVVKRTLESLNEKDIYKEYPVEKHGKKSTKAFFLFHLTAHLNYHLGQINYLRRVLEPAQQS